MRAISSHNFELRNGGNAVSPRIVVLCTSEGRELPVGEPLAFGRKRQ